MFNDDQKEYMKDLEANPLNVCGCGWYTKEDCWTLCHHKDKQRVEEARVSKVVLREREMCAQKVDAECRQYYDLTNADDEEQTRRRHIRAALNTVADAIRRIPWNINTDMYRVPK